MKACEAGYFCRVCGEYVEDITESELYLRFVMGELAPELLRSGEEAHISCSTALAQYIADPAFPQVMEFQPDLDRRRKDPARVAARQDLVTRAWRRLQTLPGSGLKLAEYPLDDVRPNWLPAPVEPGGAGR